MLLLDEPTNHLDMETIDALADAINGFEGGVVLVSHDFRLIDQVVDKIWICENAKVTEWEGDILSYKDHLKAKVMKESNKDAKSKFIKFLLKINVFYVTVIIFKETVLVFSSDLPCKDGNARFTKVSLKIKM